LNVEDMKIAFVDLTKEEVKIKPIPMELRRLYLGGRGIAMYLLYNYIPKGADPMGPDNIVVCSAGFLGGMMASAGRTNWSSKSPETGIIGDGNHGGDFSPELRYAGFDHVVIMGRAEKPRYIYVHDGEVEIKDASHLHGRDTIEYPQMIRSDLGDPEIQVAGVGPAGDNKVRWANCMTGYKRSARGATGGTMGSKNCKCIAARGTLGVDMAFPDQYYEYVTQEVFPRVQKVRWLRQLGSYGTMAIFGPNNWLGALRTCNSLLTMMETARGLEADVIEEKYVLKHLACRYCPVHCGARILVRSGKYATYGEEPEYVTMGQIGPNLGVNNLEGILKMHNECNRMGLDCSSFGSTLSWATEIYQRGLLTKEDTEGIPLEWGDVDTYIDMTRRIAYREGKLGNLLAEGVRLASEKVGKNSGRYLQGSKWMPGSDPHDVRKLRGFALGWAVSTRGADHLRNRPANEILSLPLQAKLACYGPDGEKISSEQTSYDGKDFMVWWTENLMTLFDATEVCKFWCKGFNNVHGLGYEELQKLIYLGTGMSFTIDELREIGERTLILERMFNNREAGLTRKDDRLSPRMYSEPMPTGPAKGQMVDWDKFNVMLDGYYRLRGCDLETGLPTKETLDRLKLSGEPSHKL